MLKSIICAACVVILLSAPTDLTRLPTQRYHESTSTHLAGLNDDEYALMETVVAVYRAKGREPPVFDPSITLACRRLCQVLDCRDIDSVQAWEPQTIQFTLRSFGITDAFYFPLVAQVDNAEEAGQLLVSLVEEELLTVGVNRFGLALDDGNGTMFAAVFTRRLTQLGPFPKQVEPGTTHLLWGGLVDGARNPSFILSTPDDAFFQKPLKTTEGLFWTQVFFPEEPGKYTVEVMVEVDGPQVASLYPVYVGVPVPLRPVFKLYPGVDENGGARGMERQVLKLINRERSKRDLDSCRWSAALAASARQYSRTMAKARRLSHVLDPDGSPGFDFTENISLSTSLHAAHANLMSSPTHRRNLLDRDAQHCGVGVVQVAKGDGTKLLYITQRFTRQLP